MRPRLGLNLSELTPQLATEKKLVGVRGLLIRDVDPNGIAADAGVRPDEAIVRINRLPVATLADFERVVNALKPGDAIVLHVATPREGRVAQRIVQFTFQ
jgi:S1-C subfamily serine protease